MSAFQNSLPAATPGHPTQPRRDYGGIQIRLCELFKGKAVQPNDVLRCHKRYGAGRNLNVLVDAHVVVCAEVKDTIKSSSSRTVKFDIIEDGRRSLLGSFTGPTGIVKALVRRIGGLRTGTPVPVSPKVWEDFEIFRNGISLGTAGHVRQHYHARHQNEDNQPVVTVALPTIAANVNLAVFQTPDLSEFMHSMNLSALGRDSFHADNAKIAKIAKTATIGNLNSMASTALALLDLTTSTTSSAPMQPPQTTMTQPTRRKSAKKSNDNSDQRLQDALMQELYAKLPPKFQPERYNQKYTAIAAKDCIEFMRERIFELYRMIVLMGVTKESLLDVVQKMGEGADAVEAMRQGLEWSEEGPMGAPDSGDEEEKEDAENDKEAEGAEDADVEMADK